MTTYELYERDTGEEAYYHDATGTVVYNVEYIMWLENELAAYIQTYNPYEW